MNNLKMNNEKMFNQPINIESAVDYIKNKGLSESSATNINKRLAKYFKRLSELYDGYTTSGLTNNHFSLKMYMRSVHYEQQATACCWLMIYTAICEHKNNLKYVETYNQYVDWAISKYGLDIPKDKKLHIDIAHDLMITDNRLRKNKYIPSVHYISMQYWVMRYDKLIKDGK